MSDPKQTVIGHGAIFKGTIEAPNQLVVVNGSVEGEISCTQLVVSNSGRVVGNISATEVVLAGTIIGNIVAANKVLLEKTARFEGGSGKDVCTITTKSITMADGAHLEGRVSMIGSEPSAAEAKAQPTPQVASKKIQPDV